MMIKSIYIENFMSIGSATIEFDDSNILSLCGYNDSGKSAIIRLIDIMFYNAYANEQVHYIKDGESSFRCIVSFKDGVEYERIKYTTGSSVFMLRKDGEVLFDNRKGNQIINTDGVPKVISDYLGVVRDEYTKEELNVRRCTDRLFLIDTTGGDNYKIINTILQSDRLAETSNKLNIDKNKLQQEIVISCNRLSALKDEHDRMQVASKDVIDALEVNTDRLEELNERLEKIGVCNYNNDIVNTTYIPDEIPMIDIIRCYEIKKVKEYHDRTDIHIQPMVDIIDFSRLSLITEVVRDYERTDVVIQSKVDIIDTDRYEEIKGILKKVSESDIIVPEGVDEIDFKKFEDIQKLVSLSTTYKSHVLNYELLESQVKETEVALKTFADEHNLTICSNCGAVVSKEIGGHVHE